MATPVSEAYQAPVYAPGTGQGYIRRHNCSICPVGDCYTFISIDGTTSVCLCEHHWHQHQPDWKRGGREEIPDDYAIYRRDGRTSTSCTGYYPKTWPPVLQTPCICGESLNRHQPRSTAQASAIEPQPPAPIQIAPLASASTRASVPQDPAPAPVSVPAQVSHGASTVPLLANPVPSVPAPAGPVGPPLGALLDGNTGEAMQNAASRRVSEAAAVFGPQLSVQTRTFAPGPTRPSNISDLFNPPSVAPGGARRAYDSTPTATNVPPVVSANRNPPITVTFAVFPCAFQAQPRTLEDSDCQSLRVQLVQRHKALMRRLDSLGLLIDYTCPEGSDVQGPAFLDILDKHITDTLRRRGWRFPPQMRPDNVVELEYSHLSWTFVFYRQKKILVPVGDNQSEKRYLLVSSLSTPIVDFGPKTLEESPFGATAKRPQHPSVTGRPLIYIMGNNCILYGREPDNPDIREALRWRYQPDSFRQEFLHACVARRVMNGWTNDDFHQQPGMWAQRCDFNCLLHVDTESLLPPDPLNDWSKDHFVTVSAATEIYYDRLDAEWEASFGEGANANESVDATNSGGNQETPPPGAEPHPNIVQIEEEPPQNIIQIESDLAEEEPHLNIVDLEDDPAEAEPLADSDPPLQTGDHPQNLRLITVQALVSQLAAERSENLRSMPASLRNVLLERPPLPRVRPRSPSTEALLNERPAQRPRLVQERLFNLPTSPPLVNYSSRAVVNNMILHVLQTCSSHGARLRAPSSETATNAIWNMLIRLTLHKIPINVLGNVDIQRLMRDEGQAEWVGGRPTTLQDLFSHQFFLYIGGSHGSGTIRDVATRLVALAMAQDVMLDGPSGHYKSIRPLDELHSSTSRQLRISVAAVVMMFHMVWARAGADPISPFLLFAVLALDLSELVDPHFIRLLDDGDHVNKFFMALSSVEEARRNDQRPVLNPMKEFLAIYKELQVLDIESSEYEMNTQSLREVIISLLGETMGIRGIVAPEGLHHDLRAFKRGIDVFVNALNLGNDFWPTGRDLKSFICTLYNRQPTGANDLPIMFRSTGKASLRSLEERWEVRLREYLAGKGVPMMAAWVAQPTNIDMNSDSARSITLLRAASASTLMPLNEGWGLEFVFKDEMSKPQAEWNLDFHPHGLSFHTCDRSIEVSLIPFTQQLVACPKAFEAVLHIGLLTADGYGDEIPYYRAESVL